MRSNRISLQSKVGTWLISQLMWRFVRRSSLVSRLFYLFLHAIRRNRERVLTILGQKLNVNPYRTAMELRLSLFRMYEPEVVEYILEHLSSGMTVVDIGSNLGFFALLSAELVGASGRVVCYEPIPDTFERLLQNIALNSYKNILPVQYAISDSLGMVRMSVNEDSSLDSFVVSKRQRVVEVPTNTLDGSLSGLSIEKCDLIKMDIEGAEILAIRGMERTICNNPKIQFIIETHTSEMQQLGGTLEQLLQFFANHGFDLYELNVWRGLARISVSAHTAIRGHLVCRKG